MDYPALKEVFARFVAEPEISAAIARLGPHNELAMTLVLTSFVEGAKYAASRCKAAGH